VTPRPTPRLTAYATIVALGLLGALAARRAELAVAVVPFALVLALGLTRRPPSVRVGFAVDTDRALEDEDVPATVDLDSDGGVARAEVRLVVPPGVEVVDDTLPVAVSLQAGESRELPIALRARWGSWTIGDLRVRARDRLGVLTWERRVARPHAIRVYPQPERLRRLLTPAQTQVTTGNETSRARADGLEFADTRPFVPGDRLRSVNWRATARRGTLVVNERHPDRNADVVLLLDSFVDVGDARDGALGRSVRAAATLADRYLARRDRVGLVSFGGTLRWLEPGSGPVQRYLLVDALLETQVHFSYAWKDVNVIPARTLPPHALVIAISPLLDERAVAAMLDLRARGHDLAVVELAPEVFLEPGGDEIDRLAWRLWQLRRTAVRERLRGMGVAVARWDDETGLETTFEEVRAYRRHATLARR
jgi:uncharacterized protein (DUF58 family)